MHFTKMLVTHFISIWLQVKEVLKNNRFDIVAVLPRTDKMYETACMDLNIDIICIDGNNKIPYVMRHSPTQVAIKRGKYFEVSPWSY